MKKERILRRYNALKTDRTEVEEVWKLLERFVMPFRGRFYMEKETDQKPDWRRREIYDSTAIDAAGSLAASLQGNLVSPSVRWFDLIFRDNKTNKEDAAREWLEEASDKIYYQLQQSNFNLETSEGFMDLVSFGTMAIIEEEGDEDVLDFSCVPIRECYFEEDSKGEVYNFYRKLEWSAVQIADKFAPDGNFENLPDVVKARLEADDIREDNRFEICFCIYRRPLSEIGTVDLSQPLEPKRRPFGFRYIMAEGCFELGEEGGYYEMPAFVPRWRTTAGSRWGNAPGLPVLSTIMTLNQATQATLESAEKMIEPPVMTTQRGLIGDLDIRRGGINIVNDMNDLAPFPVGGDINAGIIVVEDLRGQIRRAFFEDQLELKESPAMTATEVNVRYELMQRLLGPTLGRLQSDLLDPLIKRTMAILIRAGEIDMPPEEAMEGGDIDVEYIGPLPRSQKADKAAAMLGWMGQIASLIEIKPEVADIPNWDNLFIEIGQLTGVPATVMNSLDEIKEIRDQRAAEMRRMQEAQQKQEEGKAMQEMAAGATDMTTAAEAVPPEAIAALQQSVPPRIVR